jgi:hypothetical protein
VTFLFWNLNRKPLQHLLAALVEEHDVDVVLLVENKIPVTDLLQGCIKLGSSHASAVIYGSWAL